VRVRSLLARGVTLIEMVAAILIVAIIGAMVLPIMNGATDMLAESANVRRTAERVGYAMERSVRMLRDVPPGAVEGELGVTTASATAILLSDGRGIELRSGVLVLIAPEGESELARDVTRFEIGYIASDGRTSSIATPRLASRFTVVIESGGFVLSCAATPRVRMVGL
jgi:prepilin-type N-terminal cleavage/methylation domain-containing protein